MPNPGLQLTLPFWQRGTLKEALDSYRRMKMRYLAEGTLKSYFEDESWLIKRLGESTLLAHITMETLEEVWEDEQKNPKGAMGVTVRRKFFHLRAACDYAVKRKVIPRDAMPDMPFVPNDSRPGQRVVGLAEFQKLCTALRGRALDFALLSYWTGHRAADVHEMRRAHLEPDYQWVNEHGEVVALGRFWRVSSKTNRKTGRVAVEPAWIIMEKECRDVAKRLLGERHGCPDDPILGRVWGLAQSFGSACDRLGMPRISPSRDLRRSFASMLAARGYDTVYIQMALGHVGAAEFYMMGEYRKTKAPTVADRHYIRSTHEMMIRQAGLRRAAQ
jgi:integrase